MKPRNTREQSFGRPTYGEGKSVFTVDDFEVIDDLSEERKNKLKSYDFRQKKPNKCLITREISRYFDRETYLQASLKEMLIFIGFIITLCVITSSSTTSVEYFYTQAFTEIFIDAKFSSKTTEILSFSEINSLDHIWPYLEEIFLHNIYWTYWYLTSTENIELSPEDSNILYSNKLIGFPRMRQVRVKNDSCEIPDDFKLMFSACYAEYSEDAEERGAFGPGNSSAWTYSEQRTLNSHKFGGEISTYGGGGYYVDFKSTRELSAAIIEELKHNLWLDRASRLVIIDFTTYNANINFFCMLKLVFELPPTGGVLPFYQIETHQFIRLDNVWSYVLMVFEIIFVVYCLIYLIEEVYEIIYFKWHYIKSFWNWLDLVLLLLMFTVIILHYYRNIYIKNNLKRIVQMQDAHPEFEDLLSIEEWFITSLSFLIFISWVKLLKYLSINHSMYQMQATLARASKDILCFSVIFFTVFIAFAQLGHLLFGSQVADFRTFAKAIFALLRTVVGDFDYQAIENANHLLGPIYFFSYIFFIFFILVNMFLAIIIDTYSEVRNDIHAAGIKTHLGDVFGKCFNKLLRRVGLRKLAESRENRAEKEFAYSTYQEIRNLLRRCGFTELEIDIFFAKYEITEDRLISQDEMRKILSNVEELPKGQGESGLLPIPQDFETTSAKLTERINILEDATIAANNKIDIILNKLDGMQQLKTSRRYTP